MRRRIWRLLILTHDFFFENSGMCVKRSPKNRKLSRRSNNILLTSANRWFAYGTKITNPGQTIRPLMSTEIVSYVTLSYSYSWAANVTFIIGKTGWINCNVCVLTARSRGVRNCPRTQRVVCLTLTPVPWKSRDIWITPTPLSEPSPIHTGESFHSNMRIYSIVKTSYLLWIIIFIAFSALAR